MRGELGRGILRAALLAAVAVLVLAASGGAATSYVFPLTEVGTIPGDRQGADSFPTGINDRGDVIGISELDDSRTEHGFFWDGTMHDLGNVTPTGVNDRGQVVGYRNDDGVPFRYDADAGLQELPFEGRPYDINNAGEIVGRAYDAEGNVGGFVYDETGVHMHLETGAIYAINDAASYVGVTPDSHGFVHDEGGYRDIGDLGGGAAVGVDINDFGTVLGSGQTALGVWHTFVNDGAIHDLGRGGEVLDINNCGDVTNGRAFYHAGEWLDDLRWTFDDETGRVYDPVGAVNNHGQVAFTTDDDPFGVQAARLETGFGCPLPLRATVASDGTDLDSGAPVTYTFQLANPNPGAVTATALTSTIPAGFSYLSGSSAGATAADPTVDGQVLTWRGSFAIPSDGVITLSFIATTGSESGEFRTRVDATSPGWPVTPGISPKVTVKAGGPRPLIFIPGITGTSLRNDGGELWPRPRTLNDSDSDDFLNPLRLGADGVSPLFRADPDYTSVRVNDDKGYNGVIDDAQGCGLWGTVCKGPDIYKPTIEFLEDSDHAYRFKRGESLFMFPYDWRLSVATNARNLRAEIASILERPAIKSKGWKKVDILAHSQGGLVVNALLSSSRPISDSVSGKVAHVVTMGTPWVGAVKALGELDYAKPCQVMRGNKCILNPRKLQELVTNFPGFLELLPSDAYTRMVTHPLRDPNGALLDMQAVRDTRLRDRNRALILNANALHDDIDRWAPADPKVKLLRIVGTKERTRRRIVERPGACPKPLSRRCNAETRMSFMWGGGDGTVSTRAADLCNPGASYDLRGRGRNTYEPNTEHLELAQRDHSLAKALRFFQNTFSPAQAPCSSGAAAATAARASTVAADDDADPDTDPAEIPGLLDGVDVRTDGPLTGTIVDASGAAVGTNGDGDWIFDAPGSDFLAWDDTADYFVQADGPYTASWHATADGEADVVISQYADDEVTAQLTSPPVDVRAGAALSVGYAIPFDPFVPLALKVDDDGNGTVDRSISFGAPLEGEAVGDLTPPVSSIAVTPYTGVGGRRVFVDVTAVDEGGSGVARIDYEAPALGLSGVYEHRLDLPACGDFFARATDRAGNGESAIASATLDDHVGRPDLVEQFLPTHTNADGYLDCAADADMWGLDLAAGPHKIELIGLKSDYDLTLYDADGKGVATSTRRGSASEKIQVVLPAGHFVAGVTGYAGAFDTKHSYRLSAR